MGPDGYVAFYLGLAGQTGIGAGFKFLLFDGGAGGQILLAGDHFNGAG